MAKTKSSVHGVQNKKIVTVKSYKRSDGTNVRAHRRSTPNQNDPQALAWGFLTYKFRNPRQKYRGNIVSLQYAENVII